MNHTAFLSNQGRYTIFQFNDRKLRFIGPYSLQRYEKVQQWDNGYLVVLAKYAHQSEPEEEYIDLKPVLEDLYMDADAFLKPIRSVEVRYDD